MWCGLGIVVLLVVVVIVMGWDIGVLMCLFMVSIVWFE